MITQADLQYLNGADVYATDGGKIGSASQVYLDDRTGEPEWISVHTGMFGTKESFVPLGDAVLTEDRLEVPFDKDRVKGAPQIDADTDLNPADEDKLYTYYGLGSGHGRPGTDSTMSRSVAGTRPEQSGAARLRKYMVTKQR